MDSVTELKDSLFNSGVRHTEGFLVIVQPGNYYLNGDVTEIDTGVSDVQFVSAVPYQPVRNLYFWKDTDESVGWSFSNITFEFSGAAQMAAIDARRVDLQTEITNCTFIGNKDINSLIVNISSGNLVVRDTWFMDNEATLIESSAISSTIFNINVISSGGGIRQRKSGDLPSSLSINDSTFLNSSGLMIDVIADSLTVENTNFISSKERSIKSSSTNNNITNCKFTSSVTNGKEGGAILFDAPSQINTLLKVEISGYVTYGESSSKYYNGGALMINDTSSATLIEESMFVNNTGGSGGAIYSNGLLTIQSSFFGSNIASVEGGAVYAAGGSTIQSSIFKNNVATQAGSAIFFKSSYELLNYTGGNKKKEDAVWIGGTGFTDPDSSKFYCDRINNGTFSFGEPVVNITNSRVVDGMIPTTGQENSYVVDYRIINSDGNLAVSISGINTTGECRKYSPKSGFPIVSCTYNIPEGTGANNSVVASNFCTIGQVLSDYSYFPPSVDTAEYNPSLGELTIFGSNFGNGSALLLDQIDCASLTADHIIIKCTVRNRNLMADNTPRSLLVGNQATSYIIKSIKDPIVVDIIDRSKGASQNVEAIYESITQYFLRPNVTNPLVISDSGVSITALYLEEEVSSITVNIDGLKSSASFPTSVLSSIRNQRRSSNASLASLLVFSSLPSSDSFKSSQGNSDIAIFSSVYGLNLVDDEGKKVEVSGAQEDISIVMQITSNQVDPKELKCLYWNEMKSKWEGNGCKVGKISVETVECLCNHLTNFTLGRSVSKEKSTPVGLIVGVVIGGTVLIAIVSIILLFLLKKRSKNTWEQKTEDMKLNSVSSEEVDLKIQDKVGEGSTYTVYSSLESSTTLVALKVLKKGQPKSNFLNESDVLQRLHHPNIVQFLRKFQNKSGELCMVLEFMPCGTLRNHLAHSEPNLSTSLHIILGVISALRYIKEMGIEGVRINSEDILLKDGMDGIKVAKLSKFGQTSKSEDIMSQLGSLIYEISFSGKSKLNHQKKKEILSGENPSSPFEELNDMITKCLRKETDLAILGEEIMKKLGINRKNEEFDNNDEGNYVTK